MNPKWDLAKRDPGHTQSEMTGTNPSLRVLHDGDRNVPASPNSRPRIPPGLYRPTVTCKKCDVCVRRAAKQAGPKEKCLNPTYQPTWQYRVSIRGQKYQETTRCTNLQNAIEVARNLHDEWERQAAGLPSRDRVLVKDAEKGFRKHIKANFRGKKGNRKERVAKVMRLLSEVFDEAAKRGPAVRFVDKIEAEVYDNWTEYADEQDFANRTRNDRIRVLQRFGNWLRATRKLPHDPFEILSLLPDKKDIRRVRRALWPLECQDLIRATLRRQTNEERAKNAKSKTGLTPKVVKRRSLRFKAVRLAGYVRALVYFTFLRTGLRRDESKRIRILDVRFDEGRIRVPPDVAKGGVEQFVQMDKVLARHLRTYIRRLGDVDRASPLFGFTRIVEGKDVQYSWVPSMTTFYKDLAAAGIPKKDEMDRVVDTHALRKSFITHLWMIPDAKPQEVQRLARHSDIKLTQQVYTDYEKLVGQERAAAEKLVWLWKPA